VSTRRRPGRPVPGRLGRCAANAGDRS
jgi:hypothetical protein